MRLPKNLPPDVLHKLPLEAEWHSEEWTADTEYAHKHFFRKTLNEAELLFRENSILYQEDIMWMPFIPCCYYLQAYVRYILSAHSEGDSDGASCFITLIGWLGKDISRTPSDLTEMVDSALIRIANGQVFFHANEALYGSFKDRAEKERSLTKH